MTDNNSSHKNAVMPFEFAISEGKRADVRVLWRDDAPWFVARDVAEVLGYSNPHDAIRRHCKGVRETRTPSVGGTQAIKIIPERDLYRLIMRSKLPAAERFEEWIVGDVLPSIRKTGSYSSAPALPDFEDPAEAAQAWAEQYKLRRALAQENVVMQPKARFHDRVKKADGTHTVEEVAKMLRTGRNKLFRWLREEKILMHNNLPYQQYLNQGLFRVVEKPYYRGDTPHLNRQTLITGKGLIVLQHRLDNSLLGRML